MLMRGGDQYSLWRLRPCRLWKDSSDGAKEIAVRRSIHALFRDLLYNWGRSKSEHRVWYLLHSHHNFPIAKIRREKESKQACRGAQDQQWAYWCRQTTMPAAKRAKNPRPTAIFPRNGRPPGSQKFIFSTDLPRVEPAPSVAHQSVKYFFIPFKGKRGCHT